MAGMMRMEPNMGRADRYCRISVGSLLLVASTARMNREGGLSGLGTALLGGMMVAEGVLGTCPFYPFLGIDTREEQTNNVIYPYEGI